jgi:hypothetical protein
MFRENVMFIVLKFRYNLNVLNLNKLQMFESFFNLGMNIRNFHDNRNVLPFLEVFLR